MKRILSILLAGVMTVSLAACGGSDSSPSAGTAEETEEVSATAAAETAPVGTVPAETSEEVSDIDYRSSDNDLVIAIQADATNLDPHVSGNGVSNMITDTMYETLVEFDENYEIVPLLAKSWTMSDDGISYTFELKEGIFFTDGEPFNAEAVYANWQRAVANPGMRVATQVAYWEDVTVDDEYTVTITLTGPNNTFLNKLSQVRIISPKAIDELGTDGLAKESAGTGPYILSERIDGGYTKLVRNDNYWGEGPSVDSVTFNVVPEDGSRIAMLKTGEADIIYPLPAIQVPQIENDDSIEVLVGRGTTYRYATLNTNYTLSDGRQPLSDVRVRQAMNYAFDSSAYAQVVFQGYSTEPTSVIPSPVKYHFEQTPYTKDIEKARALMAEAGYEDGFPITIWCDNTTIEMQGAEFFQQQMADINIDVTVLPMESTTIADMTSASEDETEVQIWYVNWSSGTYDADGSMRNILHGGYFPPTGYNTAFWNNEEFNECLDRALLSVSDDEIEALYAEAQAVAWEECPWVFLGVDQSLYAQKIYVKGVDYEPTMRIRTAELIR